MLNKLAGQNILVTGHTGFKGAWLTLWLNRLGARVHGLAFDPLPGSLFELAGIESLLQSDHRVDIRDESSVASVLASVAPDAVMHLAAQPLVRESYLRPAETFATNVTGTINVLLGALATSSVRSVLVVTTDKVYRNLEHSRPYVEDDPLGGDDPYSASKACAEIVTHSIGRSFGRAEVEITTVRSGNVLGGGDIAPDRLLPDLVRAFSNGVPAVLRYPQAVRPWQHVLDPLHGYLRVVDRHLTGGSVPSINLGPAPDDLMTVGRVAHIASEHWGEGATVIVDGETEHPHEAGLLILDSTRAFNEIGWRPATSGREAVQRTVDWYRSTLGGENARDAMLNDIAAFT